VESANVTLVRSIYAAWERGDFDSADWAHPDIEVVSADGPTPGSSTGLTETWRDFFSAWADFRVEVDDYIELEGDRVLVLARFRGRGKASGLELDQVPAQAGAVYHVRAGKVTRQVFYWDSKRALADLGLPPEAGTTP
jgi:ketosteroid isomerase-like protein